MYPAKHLSVSVKRTPKDVYEFTGNPQNLPQWAAGLSGSTIVQVGNEWICESPMGRVKVKFAPTNSFGVMDHDVTLPSGEINHNPFRVFSNASGSEIVFTLYRLPQMDEADFKRDEAMIRRDLQRLKEILEG